jgi:hypothetical protein
MPFRVKNGLLPYQKVATKTFKKYLDNFMKIFLDDFIVTWTVIYKSLDYVFKSVENMTLI